MPFNRDGSVLGYIKYALITDEIAKFKTEFRKANGCRPTETQVHEYAVSITKGITEKSATLYRREGNKADFSKFSPLITLSFAGIVFTATQVKHPLAWVPCAIFLANGLVLAVFWAIDSARK